ncbi:MAG: GNAT family N-acetyltransferase [Bacteroidaceae bacterium]|nr:GNAT family N-acetyltransferase [Bacteroidaceae bacterium]
MNSITLRALEPEDLELLYRIENNPDYWHWGPTNVPYSRFVLRQYLQDNTSDIFADKQVRLVAVCGSEPVGLVDLTDFDPQHGRAQIGLCLLPEWQGKHISLPVVEALKGFSARLHLRQIYALIAVTNTPAMHLFASASFRHTATLDSWLRLPDNSYTDVAVWQLFL